MPRPRHFRRPIALALALAASPLSPASAARLDDSDAAPLSRDAEERLVAFTRLLGLVRFFHPSDQAARVDWNARAVAGVEALARPGDPGANFVDPLDLWLRPLAPTARVFPADGPAPSPVLARPESGGPFRRVGWRHLGVRLDASFKQWSSERIDDATPAGWGNLYQRIDAAPYRDQTIRLRARVRSDLPGRGRAQLWLRVDRPGGAVSFLDNMADRPIRDRTFRTYEIAGPVAADAEAIAVGLAVTAGDGEGTVRIDEIELSPAVRGAGPLANPAFEDGESGRQPEGWAFPRESLRAGYRLRLVRDGGCVRGGCAEIVADPAASPRIADPDRPLVTALGAGVSVALPLAVWADARGTLPHAGSSVEVTSQSADGATPSRAERLAAVALAWSVLDRFHPDLGIRFEPEPEQSATAWSLVLRRALREAAVAATPGAQLAALEHLVAELPDGNAGVSHPTLSPTHTLPLDWADVAGDLLVTAVAHGAGDVRPGDRIVALDGRPIAAPLAEAEERTAGATPEGRRATALARLASGGQGSTIRLTLARAGGAPFEVTVARSLPIESVVASRPAVDEPAPGILYLDLRRLTDDEFVRLLPRLAAARGLVFDVRGAPTTSNEVLAHRVDRPAESSNWLIPIATGPDRRQRLWLTTYWNLLPKAPRLRARTAFLCDARATGYAETLLALVESERLGEIVGTRSGGSNGTVNWLDLPGRYRLAFTGMRVLGRDGKPVVGRGIAPTIAASPTAAGLAAGRDEVLERAVEVVGGRER